MMPYRNPITRIIHRYNTLHSETSLLRPHVLEFHVYVTPHLYIHNVTYIASEIKNIMWYVCTWSFRYIHTTFPGTWHIYTVCFLWKRCHGYPHYVVCVYPIICYITWYKKDCLRLKLNYYFFSILITRSILEGCRYPVYFSSH